MGGGGGKGGGGSTVQQVQIPPEVLARYNAVNARAEQVAATPFQPYTGEFVAPLNQTQLSGIDATSKASQMAQPYYGAATQATLGGMKNVGPLTQQQIGYYQNPYTQAVVDPTLRALQQQQGQQLSQQQTDAIKGGAFGGDRAGIQRATLQGQQNLALGNAIAPLYQQGYNTAVQTAMGQQGVVAADLARQLTGGQQLGNLGSAAQQAALSGAQAQIAAGTLPQQTQQAEDTAKYQQFMQEKGYPFQTTQFLANIAEGTGALSGNTTTQTQGGGFFSSDARLKENIEPIGELFDGQTVYRYNYKDDKRKTTQIGLIAQEAAEERKPGVGVDDDGFLAVNYHDVTDDAAEAGKGLVPNSMGGAVREAGAFARGGYATQGGVDFGSLLAAQQAMYDANPVTAKKKSGEGGLGIPSESKAPRSLQVPAMLKPDKKENPIKSAMEMGQGVAKTGEAIKSISKMSPIQGTKSWWNETFGSGDKNTTRVGAESPAAAKGSPGAPSPAAPAKTTGLAPAGDKLQTAEFKGPGLGQYGDSFGRSSAPTGVAPQYASATMNDAGRQPFMPDANNNVDVAYSGQAYEIQPTAAQPPLQGIQAQNTAFQTADGGSGLDTAADDSLKNMGGDNMDFASSLDSLGDFADYGSNAMDFADARDFADFGDAMAFVKRGGRIGNYANGGLVPRQYYAGAGFVTPGYDTEHNPMDIMDQTLDQQEEESKDDASQFNAMKPKGGGGGGGGDGGFGVGDAIKGVGTAVQLFSMFSDARLKKNIEPVGKTYDGQTIYRYDFGDGKTQLGLIAQEVAKHTPHAVHKKDGYLTVDYKHATEAAAPRHAYADGGGSRFVTDDERLQQLLSAGQKAPSEASARYRTDNGAELRGSTMLSGPFTEYGAGLGVDLGGGRLNIDAARGSAPGSQPQYRGKLGWSKNFASGGLVPREYHNGEDGNVVGQTFDREAVAAAANDDEPIGLDPRLMALAPDTSQPRNVRNNNPGNLEASSWTQKQPGYVGTDGRFAIFETPEHGSQAMQTLIANKASKGMNTPASLITSWASEPGSPPPEAYVRHVAKTLGIGPNDPFDASDPAVREKLATAMFQFEGGNKVKGEAAPRPPKDVGPSEPGLGSFLSGKSGKGKFDGVEAKNASLGDVFREYAPSGMPTSENAWLPALGFLGGMLSSPNPKLLGAIGSGLVSGVSTQFELDKLNEDRVKNAYNMMKDRFTDSMQIDANGMPYMMKLDNDTGKLYTPEQMTAIRGNILKAIGVNPASYGVVGATSQQSVKGDNAVAPSAPAALPKPGETKVAEGEAGASGSATAPKKAADPIRAAATAMYPLPPDGMDQTEMSKAQLKSAAFWNPKEYSVAEDPMAIVANIQNLKTRVKAWDARGTPEATKTANEFKGQIKAETDRLDAILGEAVENIAERNKGIQAATVAKADKFGDEIKQRTEKYRIIRSQLLRLADLQAEGLNTGKGAEAVRDMVSFAQTISGGAIEMPFLSSLTNAGQFDHAAKIAAAQIVNGVKEAGLQRAPAAGLKTEAKITPSTEMSPGGIHQLLGQMLGEMDYVHERDKAYMQGKNRWSDPSKFMDKYDQEGGPKGGDYKYNKKVAEAFSQLPIPTKGGKDIPEVIDSLRRKYGELAEIDYGYRPKGQKKVAPAAAPAISPAERASALEWLNRPENANDPRAAQIRQRLGVQ